MVDVAIEDLALDLAIDIRGIEDDLLQVSILPQSIYIYIIISTPIVHLPANAFIPIPTICEIRTNIFSSYYLYIYI